MVIGLALLTATITQSDELDNARHDPSGTI